MLARLSRAERLFTFAQKLSAHGKTEEAIEAFEATYDLSPTHTGVHLHWALALSEAGRHEEACEIMHRAIKLQPSRSVLHLFLGQIWYDHEDYLEAKKHFQTAIDYDPINLHAPAFLALIELMDEKIQESYQGLTRPISIPTGTIEHAIFRLGLFQPPSMQQFANVALQSRILLAIETYFCERGLSPRSLSQQLVDLQQSSRSHFSSRCLGTIDTLLTHVILGTKRLFVSLRYLSDRNARRFALRHIAADEAYYRCQTTPAIMAYQKLLEQRPDSMTIQQRLFDLYYETGNFEQSLIHLQDLTHYGTSQHHPTPLECLYLGELFYLTGRTQEGRHYLEQAETSPMSEFKLHYFLGLDEVSAGRKKIARQHFAQALRILNPDICLLRLQELHHIHHRTRPKKPMERTEPVWLD